MPNAFAPATTNAIAFAASRESFRSGSLSNAKFSDVVEAMPVSVIENATSRMVRFVAKGTGKIMMNDTRHSYRATREPRMTEQIAEPALQPLLNIDVTMPRSFVAQGFINGEDAKEAPFPTENPVDSLEVPSYRAFQVTMINAGNPAIFINAEALGLRGNEMQADVNDNAELLRKCEAIRAYAAVRMRRVDPTTININARILSMGKLHHATTGTGGVAIAVAGAIPGTVVNRLVANKAGGSIRFGHPSGVMAVGAQAEQKDGAWVVTKAIMLRTARRLMEGPSSLAPELWTFSS